MKSESIIFYTMLLLAGMASVLIMFWLTYKPMEAITEWTVG